MSDSACRQILRSEELGVPFDNGGDALSDAMFCGWNEAGVSIDFGDGTSSRIRLNTEGNSNLPGLVEIRHNFHPPVEGDREPAPLMRRAHFTLQFALGPKKSEYEWDKRWEVPGVTIEDLVAAATLRLLDLNNQHACAENEEAIAALQNAQDALARRRQDRIVRKVLGQRKD